MLDCVNVVKRYGGKFAVNGMSVAIEDAHILFMDCLGRMAAASPHG